MRLQNCGRVDANEDGNKGLKWFTFNVDGTTLYGQFVDRAIVDGLPREVNFTLNQDNTIIAKLPHFWSAAVVDPSYSVILGSPGSNCGKDTSKIKKITIIVVPTVVVFVLLIVVGVLLYPKIKSKLKVWNSKRNYNKAQETDKQAELEKIDKLEVNSASGRYVTHL
eukprot:Phypoly_transcript_23170.p1 GENE.Phypoly_transcript_23170~~Phypoly_transcript_23170.p1  ORF type:complete len:166 (+),score=25.36 Phypoly_transcript_23170:61-558(+)